MGLGTGGLGAAQGGGLGGGFFGTGSSSAIPTGRGLPPLPPLPGQAGYGGPGSAPISDTQYQYGVKGTKLGGGDYGLGFTKFGASRTPGKESGSAIPVPENPYSKGTEEFRNMEAQRQQIIQQNIDNGFTLKDMGIKNVKEGGKSIYAALGPGGFTDEYGPAADPGFQYDLRKGMRKRVYGAERMEKRKAAGESEPEWEPIPENELQEIREYMAWKASGEGGEWSKAYGGSAYMGYSRKNQLKRWSSGKGNKSVSLAWDPQRQVYWDVVGSGQVLLYDRFGRPVSEPGGKPSRQYTWDSLTGTSGGGGDDVMVGAARTVADLLGPGKGIPNTQVPGGPGTPIPGGGAGPGNKVPPGERRGFSGLADLLDQLLGARASIPKPPSSPSKVDPRTLR